LEGKYALVTGGTQGIGAAVAKLLLELGANVTLVARTKKDVDAAIAHYKNLNMQANGICADLSDKEVAKIIYDEYRKTISDTKLDILVNTVGVVLTSQTEAITHEQYETNLQTNLGSVFEMCQSFFELMKAAEGATIVNISSINGLRGTPGKVLDGITRSAVINLSKSLAAEWAEHGIRINSFA